MKKYPFINDSIIAKDATILTTEEVKYVRQAVLETFRYQLIARNVFPKESLNDQGGKKFYIYYDQDDPSEAVITMDGKAQADDYPMLDDNEVKVPVISKDFLLQWRDIAASRTQGGTDILRRSIAAATRKVAEVEDRLFISGECTTWSAYGIEGLFTATGRSAGAASGNWPANAIADVNTARSTLQGSGFDNPEPIMIGPPALIKCLDGQMANTTMTYRNFLLQNGLLSAIYESANSYAADCGQDSVVLVVPGQNNFWFVEGLPLTTVLWEDKVRNVHGHIRETVAPIIGRAASIFEITTITCA